VKNNSVKLQPDLTQIKDSGYAKLRHIPPNSANYISEANWKFMGPDFNNSPIIQKESRRDKMMIEIK